MNYIIAIIFCVLSFSVASQIEVSENTVDYSEIGPDSDLEREIFFINKGTKESLLLTNDFPREYKAHISSKTVLPEDTVYLRWKFNPFEQGKFTDIISLWFSTMERPIEIKVKGDVNYIDPYANPACPNFNERPAGQERTFLTDFLVRDENSEEPIKNAHVRLVDRGVTLANLSTNKRGEQQAKLPIRYVYFLVEAEGYEPKDLYSYVNSKNHRFVFDLSPLPEENIELAEIVTKEEVEEEIAEEIVIQKTEIDTEDELSEFSAREYSPNNIVFLVDVSGSMNTNGRMDILKSAMIEMVGMMRTEDHISLVSYARNANVLLEPTSGADKEVIIEQIRELTPQGATSGEKGLKKAYSTAKSAYIPKGNNRVYIATDGVFKVSEVQSIDKLVKKNTRRKVYLSILGIKGTPYTKKKMAELAGLGNGEFVAMEEFSVAADQLKELVKHQSKKKKN